MPVSASNIRKTLHRIAPKRVSWSARDIWNIRISAMRYCNSLSSKATFDQEVIPEIDNIFATHSPDSLDNQVDDILYPALRVSQDLF